MVTRKNYRTFDSSNTNSEKCFEGLDGTWSFAQECEFMKIESLKCNAGQSRKIKGRIWTGVSKGLQCMTLIRYLAQIQQAFCVHFNVSSILIVFRSDRGREKVVYFRKSQIQCTVKKIFGSCESLFCCRFPISKALVTDPRFSLYLNSLCLDYRCKKCNSNSALQ